MGLDRGGGGAFGRASGLLGLVAFALHHGEPGTHRVGLGSEAVGGLAGPACGAFGRRSVAPQPVRLSLEVRARGAILDARRGPALRRARRRRFLRLGLEIGHRVQPEHVAEGGGLTGRSFEGARSEAGCRVLVHRGRFEAHRDVLEVRVGGTARVAQRLARRLEQSGDRGATSGGRLPQSARVLRRGERCLLRRSQLRPRLEEGIDAVGVAVGELVERPGRYGRLAEGLDRGALRVAGVLARAHQRVAGGDERLGRLAEERPNIGIVEEVVGHRPRACRILRRNVDRSPYRADASPLRSTT